MPSHYRQELHVLWSRKKKKTGRYIWAARKTGYVNVWINGKHFYYNEKEEYDSIDDIDMEAAFNTDRRTTTKKGIIVVKKKK